ncbi:MAG: hypothetical protein Q3979_04100 [Actinomycetaceae bacterium]|nr:hypothetical protein [Actinomycetaceae bacterium]
MSGEARDKLRPYPKPQVPFDAEAALASLPSKDVDEQIDTLDDVLDGLNAQLRSTGD